MGKYFKQNKRFSILMAVLLAVCVFATVAYAADTFRGKTYFHDRSIFYKDVVMKGETTISNLSASDNIVYIDNVNDLKTWEGASAGQSWFPTEAGKAYYVDFHAIQTSKNGDGTGVSESPFSAVTAVMAKADKNSHEKKVKILVVTTGPTGYAVALTGSTEVQVWGAISSSAVTNWSATSTGTQAGTIQNIHVVQAGTNAVSAVSHDDDIAKLNETKTWVLQNNSSVSAQICAEVVH